MRWLTFIIPTTQEGTIRRIRVPGQFRQKISKTPFQQAR
jgi:hypothetical protein